MNDSHAILADVVRRLRSERLAGAAISRIIADLRSDGLDLTQITTYFREAFLLTGQANIALLPRLESNEPDPELLDGYIARLVDAARDKWHAAPPYPDLLRRRDRMTFARIAREHDIILIVCAANQDVSSEATAYRLHGAYRGATGANAWTGRDGERLRSELNIRLGADLVQGGPHDTWDERLSLDPADPRYGPQPPALFFLPDGSVEVRRDARGMELYYRFLGIDWDELYPSITDNREDTE